MRFVLHKCKRMNRHVLFYFFHLFIYQLQAEREKIEDTVARQNEAITKLNDDLHTKEDELENTSKALETSSKEIENLTQRSQQLEGWGKGS